MSYKTKNNLICQFQSLKKEPKANSHFSWLFGINNWLPYAIFVL